MEAMTAPFPGSRGSGRDCWNSIESDPTKVKKEKEKLNCVTLRVKINSQACEKLSIRRGKEKTRQEKSRKIIFVAYTFVK